MAPILLFQHFLTLHDVPPLPPKEGESLTSFVAARRMLTSSNLRCVHGLDDEEEKLVIESGVQPGYRCLPQMPSQSPVHRINYDAPSTSFNVELDARKRRLM